MCSFAFRRDAYEVRATSMRSVAPEELPILFAGVFEGWHGAQLFFGCAWQHKPIIVQLELRSRNGHVMRADAEKASRADDRIRGRPFWRDDDVLDLADLFVSVVVDTLAKYLASRTPSLDDV